MSDEFQRNPEVTQADSNQALVELLDTFGSDEAFADHFSDLTQELATVEGQIFFYVREQQIHHLGAQGRLAEHHNDIKAIYDQVHLLEAELNSNAEYRRYTSLREYVDGVAYHNRCTLSPNDPAAELLVSTLSHVSGVNDPEQHPPFMNFKQNTPDTWQYVPDQAVQDYLDELYFADTDKMDLGGNTVTIRAERGKSNPVPLALFIHAAGFASWKGRSEGNSKAWSSQEYGNGGSKSVDTIKHYAALPTDIPPVAVVNVYVQPDGFIFADNAGDSHRIGAAFLRGQKEITAETVNFIRLKENHLQYHP